MTQTNYRSMFDLSGRVALITGGGGTLGREFAAALAAHGAHIAILDIDGNGAAACCNDLAERFDTKTLPVTADLTDPASIRSAVDDVCDKLGVVNILLNNAQSRTANRSAYFAPFEQYDLAEWRRVMSVDLDGMAVMAQQVCRVMVERKIPGSLIQIGSIYGEYGPDNRIYEGASYQGVAINNPAVYSVAKAGVLGLTRWLATSYAKHGIRSNAIVPGGVESGQNKEFVERYSNRVPLGRMARRDEIAGAAVYLASDASSYVTGQALYVDGGAQRLVMSEGNPPSGRPIAPVTYDDIAGIADWRARLYWPTAQRDMLAIGARVPEQVIACAAERSDDVERQIICVAGGLFANGFMSLLEAAWMAQGCEERGIEPRGGPPEMPLIASGSENFKVQEYRGPFSVKDVPMASLKAMARVASWSRIDRLPVALLAPEAIALTHNRLMVDAIDGHAINYRHASALVVRARREHGDAALPDVTALVDSVLDRLMPLCPALNEVYRARLRRAFRGRLVNAVGRAAADVAALRKARLPKHVWSGTNGAYPTRLVAAEVRRRGGSVHVFDHGGVTAISQLPGSTALIELCTSSHFHVGTRRWAELLADSGSPRIASPLNQSTIVGQRQGDPMFRQAIRNAQPRSGARPRVMYIGHTYRGLRQFPLAGLPDVLYWDFQLQVLELLQRLDIDLICKPHPDGHFAGRRQPIADVAPTSERRFEELIDDVDVFVFDAPTSTTFAESLCTNKRVVLIDRFYPLNPAVLPHVQARCQIVAVTPDDRNRLRLDPEQFVEAVMGPQAAVDPSYFRQLLAGAD